MNIAAIVSLVSLGIWVYLIAFRGGFWLTRERDDALCPAPAAWPAITAIVPARDEAETIARCIGSLLAQDYPGPFRIVLVDDQSSDGTAGIARALDKPGRLTVLPGSERPPGWTGKLWALHQGVLSAQESAPEYFWFTDADIAHTPDNLRALVSRGEYQDLALVSLMAKLNCESFAEKLLIPAFVFFFAMLYPFSRVNNPRSRVAAAAGGCVLVRRRALEQAGGIASIRHAIIDDCTLAAAIKNLGPIWLGLTRRALSLRAYPRLGDISHMVSRSAYAQLRWSPLLLLGTVLGMAITYMAPVYFAIGGIGMVRIAGLLAWALMALAYYPMLRFYRQPAAFGLLLPLIGILYTMFTLDSAIQFWRGRGGMWKGRSQAIGPGL